MKIKANSYGVDIRDSFSICLRDKFNEFEKLYPDLELKIIKEEKQ